MSGTVKKRIRHALQATIALAPWLVSMYVLYWLDSGQIWTSDTAHRGKISVMILVVGMGLSFLTYCHFAARDRNR